MKDDAKYLNFMQSMDPEKIKNLKISNQLKFTLNLIKDIVIHVTKMLEDDRILSRTAFEFFQKIDSEGNGSITLAEVLDAFGHDGSRVDTDLTVEFNSLISEDNKGNGMIDKVDFKRYLAKGLELMIKEL